MVKLGLEYRHLMDEIFPLHDVSLLLRSLPHLSAQLLTPATQPTYCPGAHQQALVSGSLPWLLSLLGINALPPVSHGSLLHFLTSLKMLL